MQQTYPDDLFEVIVCDNGSTDHTKDICGSYANRIRHFRYGFADAPGLHVGRHLGMKMAQTDILAYADDDITAFPSWLEGIAEAFRKQAVVLVGGKVLPIFEKTPPPWILKMWEQNRRGQRILDHLSLLDLGDEVMTVDPLNIYGCNFSVRKSILEEAGGFHPDAMPEGLIHFRGDGETHISRHVARKGYTAIYHPKASVFHSVSAARLTEAYFYHRAYLQGISDSYGQIRNASFQRALFRIDLLNKLLSFRKKFGLYLHARTRHKERAYWEGFQMHQASVCEDSNLYEWVTRKHYIEGDMASVSQERNNT
jgi:glucosyl-dolichyl phosphate glucuronosyltransferase